MMNHLHNQKGVALIVTLLALVLITAMVVEFSYAVYTGTQDLYTWRDSQRLSIMARSGINVSAKYISGLANDTHFKYTEPVELPVENPFEDFTGMITVRIEDENGKFNINTIIAPGGDTSDFEYDAFKRLLKVLSLHEKLADSIADWIDPDSNARLTGAEAGAKNADLSSVDELLMIPGISKEDYNKLLPYVTVYGKRDTMIININMAEKPVLRCLSEQINDDLAQRVIDYRKSSPFTDKTELQKVSGITNDIYNRISSRLSTAGTVFLMKASASSGGVKRIIETVLNTDRQQIEYWKEY